MKVYVLNLFVYVVADELDNAILGVYSSLEKAKAHRDYFIQQYMELDYIIDEDLEQPIRNNELITMFYKKQQNWSDYIEMNITEKVVE